jgi:hypothetical protein
MADGIERTETGVPAWHGPGLRRSRHGKHRGLPLIHTFAAMKPEGPRHAPTG